MTLPLPTVPASPRRTLLLELAGVAAILLLALLLRTWNLRAESAWCDEVLTVAHLPADGLRDFLAKAFETDRALAPWPAYYVVEYAWASLFGPSLPALRALSITLNLLMLALIYLRARRVLPVSAALFCLLLSSLSLSQIYYAQEIRFYAWIGMLAVAAELSLTSALRGGSRAAWGVHVLCSVLLLLSHAFTLLFFPVLFLRVLLDRRQGVQGAARWGAAHLLILIAVYVWRMLPYDLAARSQAYNDLPVSFWALPQAWLFLSGARTGTEGAGAYLPLGTPAELLYALIPAVLLLVCLSYPVIPVKEGSHGLARTDRLGFLLWALLPLALLWGAAMLWRPCFFPRYVLYSAPGLFLCAGAGFSLIRSTWIRWGLLGAVLTLGLYLSVGMPRPFRPGYSQWAEAVRQEAAATPAVFALKRYNALGAAYALRLAPEAIECSGMSELQVAVIQQTRQGKAVWAVFHHWGALDAFAGWATAQGLRFERRQFGGLPPLHAFRLEASPGPGTGQRVE